MHEIKVDSKKCCLCNSNDTISKAIYDGKRYRIVTDCKNPNCISNNLNTHTPISSGDTTSENN